MNTIYEFICGRPKMAFNPDHYSKRLGYRCDCCDQNLTHEKCISLCKCYVFCHQHCFIHQFEPTLTREDVDIECQTCKQILPITLDVTYNYQPNKNTAKIVKALLAFLAVLICIIAIIVTLKLSIRTDLAFLFIYLQGLCLGVSIYFLAMTVRELLYRRIVTIREIKSTKLEIQTSAFKDIDIDTNEEMTKDYLIFESKKEKC